MLYDRDYMREDDGNLRRSPVVILLVVLGALFFVECYLQVYAQTSLSKWLGLSYTTVRRGEYWRLLTYQFLHSAPWPWHLLFNGIGLWFFGRSILEAVGVARFWKIYLLAGFLGGVADVICQAVHPAYAIPGQWTVGASAAVMGLVGAVCFLFPTREMVFFLYVIPVKIRSMNLFWLMFGYSVFGTIFPHGGVAHAAHLGGILTGAAFVRLFLNDDAPGWLQKLSGRRQAREEEVAVPAGGSAFRPSKGATSPPEPETPEEFMRREVDPILDKISAHGMQSLTERERRILEKARERMRNR